MKRILLLNYECPPVGGGGGVAAIKMAKEFVRRGYQVDYVTSLYKDQSRLEVIDGVNVHRVKVLWRTSLNASSALSLISYPFSACPYALKLCKKNKYEFINSHFILPSGIVGVWLAKKFNTPHILCGYGGDIYEPTKKFSPHKHYLFRKLVEYVVRKADVMFVPSQEMLYQLKSKYVVERQQLDLLPIPYDPIGPSKTSKSSLGLSEDKKYMVSVGRIVKRKGYKYLVESLVHLSNHICLVIVGDGPGMGELESLATKLGVLDRIRFVGNVTNKEKFDYLTACDVYVLSSIHEGYGIVLQEAMDAGLPIVSTDVGGQRDFLKEGYNCFFVPVYNPAEIADKVKKILDNKEVRDEMSRNNKESIKLFSPSTIGDIFFNVVKHNI